MKQLGMHQRQVKGVLIYIGCAQKAVMNRLTNPIPIS
uniref:RpoC2 n=1 Tax=Arundo donax TaxID=35708 RepID=A0A0A9FWG9_ARUDO